MHYASINKWSVDNGEMAKGRYYWVAVSEDVLEDENDTRNNSSPECTFSYEELMSL